MPSKPVVGTHIQVGYEPSETEQALVQRVHELEGRLAELESWVKAAKQFEWSHPETCPSHFSARGQCICGLDQFLYRPDLFIESYKREISMLQADRDGLLRRAEAAEISAKALGLVIEEMQRRNANR